MAKVEKHLRTRGLRQRGHFGRRRSVIERMSSSNCFPHASHLNSYSGMPAPFRVFGPAYSMASG